MASSAAKPPVPAARKVRSCAPTPAPARIDSTSRAHTSKPLSEPLSVRVRFFGLENQTEVRLAVSCRVTVAF